MSQQHLVKQSFSEKIKKISWEDHQKASSSAFINKLTSGKITKNIFGIFVAQQYFIYQQLEETSKNLTNYPKIAQFLDPALLRTQALTADMKFFTETTSTDFFKDYVPLDATQRYVQRIKDVEKLAPISFVAHHYLRYMGDLAGGQALRAIAKREYNFSDEQGLQFYNYKDIVKSKTYRDNYRNKLNTTAWEETEENQIVAEILLVYKLNTMVFEQLDKLSKNV